MRCPRPDHLGTVDEDDVAHTVWGYLDHASSWDETVARLRHYVADGNGDGAVFTEIADAIEVALQADPEEEPAGVLGLYPAVVLMLDALRATRVHGAEIDDQRQRAFVVRLIEGGVMAHAVNRVAFISDAGAGSSSNAKKVAKAVDAAFGRFGSSSCWLIVGGDEYSPFCTS